MNYHPSVGELQQNLEEIRKQHRLERLRKFLKFFLVGFLVGGDSEKRISELIARNKLILDSLVKRFIDLKYGQQRIEEFADAFTNLTYVEEQMEAFKKELGDAQNPIFDLELSTATQETC